MCSSKSTFMNFDSFVNLHKECPILHLWVALSIGRNSLFIMLLDTLQPCAQCDQARTESTNYVLPSRGAINLAPTALTWQDCHYTLPIGFVLQIPQVLLDLSLLEIKVVTHELLS